MTLLLATGDFHSSPFGEFNRAVDFSGNTDLARFLLETVEWITKIDEIDNIYVGGDITTVPGVLDAPTQRLLRRQEEIFEGAGISRIYNLGNHDISGKKTGFHNLELLSGWGGVSVVEPGTVTEFEISESRSLWVVPFTSSIEEQRFLLSLIPDSSLVAIHYPVVGAFMTPSIKEESGLLVEELSRFELTLASHYHIPHVLNVGESAKLKSGSVLVLGTPMARSFSDSGEDYGVWRIDVNSLACKFLRNPHSPTYKSIVFSNADELELEIKGCGGARRLYLSISGDSAVARGVLKNSGIEPLAVRYKNTSRAVRNSEVDRLEINREEASNLPRMALKRYVEETSPIDYDWGSIDDFLSPYWSELSSVVSRYSTVRFTKISLRNFLSWGKCDLSLESESGELVLVSGTNSDSSTASSNGSGKTSLLESIPWVLFGKTCRSFQFADGVIRNGEEECSVSIELVSDGASFRIERGRGKKSYLAVYRLNKGVWEDISKSTIQNTENLIGEVLGFTFDQFLATTFFGSSFEGGFTSLGDVPRKRQLSEMFSLDVYEELRNKVSRERSDLEGRKSSEESKLSLLREQVLSMSTERDSFLRKEEEEEKKRVFEVGVVDESLLAVSSKLDAVRGEVDKLKLEIDSLESDFLYEVNEKERILSNTLSDRRHDLDKLKNLERERTESLERTRSNLSRVKTSLLELSGETCPVCGQKTDPQKFDSRKAELRAEAVTLVGKISCLSEELKSFPGKVLSLSSEIDTSSSELLSFRERTKQKKDEYLLLKTRYSSLNSSLMDLASERASLQARKDKLSETAKHKMSDLLSSQIAEASKDLEDLENSISDIDGRLGLVSGVWEILGPKAIVSYILDGILSSLNIILEEMSSLVIGDDFSVSISPISETRTGETNSISVNVTTGAGYYGSSSDGEKRKVDLAIQLSLIILLDQESRLSTNILIGDQIFDNSLDEVAARNAVSLLEEFSTRTGRKVFIISHSTGGIVPFVSKVINVTKVGGVSELTE